MPQLKNRLPKYCLHRPSGRAYVTLDGAKIYLGPHGSRISRAEYDRVVAEWLANGRRLPPQALPDDQRDDLRLVELVERYLQHADVYYRRPDGTRTAEYTTLCGALRPLQRLYGASTASQFGPLALKTVRHAMMEAGWCRNHINKQIARIKQMFRWAAENELVTAEVCQALYTVAGLRKGRSQVRESKPVLPVPEDDVDMVLPHVSEEVAAMVQLQRLTGMRPGEVVAMRGCDLDTSGRIWSYRPRRHKTEHHDKGRTIHLGPKAQHVLGPFLSRDLSAPLFSPRVAEAKRRAARHAKRRTPMSCGNRPGTKRAVHRATPLGDHYTVASYRRAIARACDAAFPPPPALRRKQVRGKKGLRWETPLEWRERLGEQQWRVLKEWQKAHRWHPHQLRHNAATRLRKEFGIEAARVVLGHSSAAVTEVYAEIDTLKAAEIMVQVG